MYYNVIVFGAIAICIYPVWPMSLRLGLAYVSTYALPLILILLGIYFRMRLQILN